MNFVLFFSRFVGSSLTCKNLANGNIPWFASFKMPPTKDGNVHHENGMGFYYYDPDNGMSNPNGDLNTTVYNPFYYTTKPIYNDQNVGFVLVNDQPPGEDGMLGSSTYGHMKGILIFDKDSTLYIEHSCPKYLPMTNEGYYFPDNAVTNAQSFLCLTLGSDALETIAQSWLISRPIVYDYRLPSYTSTLAPSLQSVIDKKWDKKTVTKKDEFTVDGNKVYLFTKSKSYGLDIYNDFIAQELGTDLYVETWNKGATYLNMPSNCSLKYSTYNINTVSFMGNSWKRSKDHSKWAVGNNYVCISGTNRQTSQTSRGGSAFCIKNSAFASQIRMTIDDFEECA